MNHILLPVMIMVPGGDFKMGIPENQVTELFQLMVNEKKDMPYDQALREVPEFNYYLPDFEISKNPITNEEYYCFLTETGKDIEDGISLDIEKLKHPVVNVDWFDAIKLLFLAVHKDPK